MTIVARKGITIYSGMENKIHSGFIKEKDDASYMKFLQGVCRVDPFSTHWCHQILCHMIKEFSGKSTEQKQSNKMKPNLFTTFHIHIFTYNMMLNHVLD